MTQEMVYTERNNRVDLLLTDNSSGSLAITDLSALTRVVLKVNATQTLDSDTNPEYFDWATAGDEGKLYLSLGGAGLKEGHYLASLIVYDLANTDGIFWGEVQFEVTNSFGE